MLGETAKSSTEMQRNLNPGTDPDPEKAAPGQTLTGRNHRERTSGGDQASGIKRTLKARDCSGDGDSRAAWSEPREIFAGRFPALPPSSEANNHNQSVARAVPMGVELASSNHPGKITRLIESVCTVRLIGRAGVDKGGKWRERKGRSYLCYRLRRRARVACRIPLSSCAATERRAIWFFQPAKPCIPREISAVGP